jgi:Ca-activated chloride channel family protein
MKEKVLSCIRDRGIRVSPRAVLIGALVFGLCVLGGDRPAARMQEPLSVRITSPLGRLGVPGTVRIVAQIKADPAATLSPVQFYVDGKLLSSVNGGPPYAADWVDENPFEPREIEVAVADSLGRTARDTVHLKPLEVVEATDVARVLIDASVQDKTGHYIDNLDAHSFRVLEDGVPQVVDLAQKEELPATFALLIDSSQSMSRRIDFVRETASRLATYLRPRDRMLVVPFSTALGPVTGPTNDRTTVADSIGKVVSRGGTAIIDSLVEIAPLLGAIQGRRAVVLITDGYDEHSGRKFDDALGAMKSVGATVYVVGIGGVAGISLKGERLLQKLATETGGRAFLPSREEELEQVNTLLASDVQKRYLLSYTPSNQNLDGKWRAVTVDTGDPTHKVRARAGYFAPKAPPVRASIEFTVTDAERRFVDIDVDDLVVDEGGVEQKVDVFHEAVTPVSIMLALDSSGSMKKWADTAKAAATSFVDAIRPQDALGLIMFGDSSQIQVDLSTDRAKAREEINGYTPKGGTALYDAIGDSLGRLAKTEGRRAIVVVTDGRDEDNAGTKPGSVRTFKEVTDAARAVDAIIFAIGVGQNVDREVLETLARGSGGEAYFPEDVANLEAEYHRIVENLRRRWIIGYDSTNTVRDGAWRAVEIKLKNGSATVHSRGGYFAPEK